MALHLKSSASKSAAKKQAERGGSGMKQYKMEGKKMARLLILPPADEAEAVFGMNQEHKHFGADKKPIVTVASPFAFDEKDELAIKGFILKKKYEKLDDSDKKKGLWRDFVPKKEMWVNVLDLDDLDAGVQQFNLPGSAQEVVMDELEDVGDDLTTICDFVEGRPLIMKSNQKTGLQRRYKVKFAAEGAELDLTDEEKEAIEKAIFPLSKVQKKFKQEDYDKLEAFLKKKAKALGVNIDEINVKSDEDEVEEEEELEEEEGEETEIEDYEDDEEDKKKSSSKKKAPVKEEVKKKKKAPEPDEDDDFEEEEEEEKKPAKKKAPVKEEVKKKKKAPEPEDDDDDAEFEDEKSDDDFDDDDDDFEEEKKPAKKALRRK